MAALELDLKPGDAARLLRLPAFGRRAGRPAAIDCIWHDTAGGALAADGVSLGAQKGVWRLEQRGAAPGLPPNLIEEAPDLAAMGHALPAKLMPIAGFRGRQLRASFDGGEILVLDGVLRGVTQERPVCRLTLTGGAPRLLTISNEIGAAIRVTAPRWPLAAEAIALARGAAPLAQHAGAPAIPAGASLGDAMALVLGHLTDVILVGVLTAAEGRTPEPVHQLRVAIRRLRSAMSIFRRAADPGAFDPVTPGLKRLGAMLGAARDWDVFLAGTGRAVLNAMAGDRRVAAMQEAGEKRRAAAYAALGAYLASAEFHALELALIQLTALRLWEAAPAEEQAAKLAAPAEHYATPMFDRRLELMVAPGVDIAGLPVEELHAIRKAGKRLRYAAEFFAPLYGKRSTRRFIDRLSILQEALGHLNDSAAAAKLMASLGGGAERQFAAGAVEGFVAARQGDTMTDISHAWSKFRRQDPFWT
jgi:CHAD domain-containing protein